MGHSRKSANFPVPKTLKKMGRPRKNNTTSLNQKTAQEMEFTKHNKAIESIKEKKLRVYADKSRRHASEGAQALRKGDSTPLHCHHLHSCQLPHRLCLANLDIVFASSAIFQRY